jgi:uncharacterized membrane protein
MDPATPAPPPPPGAPPPPPGSLPPPPAAQAVSVTPAKVVYVLYLLSFLNGVTALVGLVVAYVYQGEAPPWLATHYRFQIRTFWIGLVYGLAGLVLTLVVVGVVAWAFIAVWTIVRSVKGIRALDRGQPIPDPATWLW